jgi:hypothetical protein
MLVVYFKDKGLLYVISSIELNLGILLQIKYAAPDMDKWI